MSAAAVPAAAARTAAALRAFAERLNLAGRLEPFRDRRWDPAAAHRRVLHLEDVSGIPFLTDIAGVEEYEHRARVRARAGDLYATETSPDPDYEAYCRQRLGLDAVHWLGADCGPAPLALARACGTGAALDGVAAFAREAGGLTIHPYLATDDVWMLAGRVAAAAAVPVAVLGPPPPVTWIANDKALFGELVELVLGPGWIPETRAATTVPGCVDLLHELAPRCTRVGLKRTRCASGTGNLVLDAAQIRAQAPAATATVVRGFLARTEWRAPEAVLAVAWETATSSPSTQWWIPAATAGEPRLDGVYEQILSGAGQLFVGSRPSTLPAAVNRALAAAGRRVAAALQALGYVGRCSFDHLVLGDPHAEFILRFTECNGRWGGTSTPMHLVDRVVSGPRPRYRGQDFVHERLQGLGFGEVLERVGGHAFDAGTQSGRYIFYNVGPLAEHGKLDVIALGATQAEAEQALLADLPRLLGL